MLPREHLGARALARARFTRATATATPPLLIHESPVAAGVRSRDRTFRRSLLIADLFAALLVVGAAELALGRGGEALPAMFLLPVLVPLVSTGAGLYRRDESVLSMSTLDEAPAVFQAATLSAVLAFAGAGVVRSEPLGAGDVGLALIGLTALMLTLRAAARGIARRLTQAERCLVVGEPAAASALASCLRTAPTVKAEVVARWSLSGGGADPAALRDLRRTMIATRTQRVVIAGDGAPAEQVHETIQLAKALGVKVSLLPGTFDVVGSSVTFDFLGGLTLLGVHRVGLSRRAQRVKRGLDVVASALLLALAAPLFAIIAVAIRLDSRGPVFFRQVRVGRDGRHFRVIKFRSMVPDAEERKAQLRALNEAVGLFKIDADPRITRVGRALRKSCLDELPQLVNVLRGEMSLVGPRPLVVDEDELIQGWHRRRLELEPGVTGPWQVLGAARIPLHEMLAIDYLYVANWSLWGDVKLLLRTIPCVLARRGQ